MTTTLSRWWARRWRWRREPVEKAIRMPWLYEMSRPTIQCPRCRHFVIDDPRGRNAHRQSCVKIPEHRPAGWGTRPFKADTDDTL